MKGIYSIRNLVTGDLYVGSSKNVDQRLREHLKGLRKGRWEEKKQSHLQNAWNKYGEDSFEFKCIDELPEDTDLKRLTEVEQYWIDVLQPVYNCNLVAGRPPISRGNGKRGQTYEQIYGEERARIIRQKHSRPRGPTPQEVREKIRQSQIGRTYEEIYGDRRIFSRSGGR